MDRLNEEEKILAWNSVWHPSFDGIAIVEKDGTFRSVNPQFCKLLGVTPAELIGKRFQDITPPGLKELDVKNAEMVVDGFIDFYILPKKYQFADGRVVEIVLLVTRAPPTEDGEFQFFVTRIMLDEKGQLLKAHQKSSAPLSYPTATSAVVGFLMSYGKWLAAIGTIIGGVLITLMGI